MRRYALTAAAAAAALALAFLAGRASRPAQVREVEIARSTYQAADRDRERWEARSSTARRVVTRETRRPSGEVRIVRVEEEGTSTAAAAELDRQHQVVAVETRERFREELARPSWRLYAAAGWRVDRWPSRTPDLFEAGAALRLGPLWAGVAAWRVEGRFYAGPTLAVDW